MTSAWTLKAIGTSGRQDLDLNQVRQAIEILAAPEYGLELRGLPSGRHRVCRGCDLDGLANAAQELADDSSIYYAINPVPSNLDHATRVGDVYSRRWMLIDVDPVRPADCSSSDAEHAAAWELASQVSRWLVEQGWLPPVVIDSGNGWHLLYRIDAPADKEHTELVKAILKGLAARFDTDQAKIDTKVHNLSRVSKLPGCWARKGPNTAERPHRPCRLVEVVDPNKINLTAILHKTRELLAPGEQQAQKSKTQPARSPWILRANGGDGAQAAYGRSALEREAGKVTIAAAGERNNALNEAGFSLGQLIAGGLLQRDEVEETLALAGMRAGLAESEIRATLRSSIDAGMKHPRQAPERTAERNGHFKSSTPPWQANEEPEAVELKDIATIADLKAAGAKVEWVWDGWIQRGVLTAIAAKAGTGKTRFCADLLRRIRYGLPWPDNAPMGMPPGSVALWIAADNNHDELATLAETLQIEDAIYLNASKSDPYAGVVLDSLDDLRALEARIKALRPAFVIIDTVGNSTDKNLSRQEDAKAFYWPLQVMARKYRCAILCLTHLNAGGQFLGRRVLEKVRLAIRMEQPDPDGEPRRLEVHKSNSKKPPALGVEMGETGNEYNNSPPARAEEGMESKPGPKAPDKKTTACAEWLKARLEMGPQRVGITRNLAEEAGFAVGTLYSAKRALRVIEYEAESRKWWRLPTDDEAF